MQNTAKYIAIVIVSLAIGAAGAGFSFYLGQKQEIESIKNQVEQSKKQAEEVKLFAPVEVFSIGGKIKSIENNIVSLDVTGFLEGGDNAKKDIRKIIVNDKTVFSRAYFRAPPVSTSFKTTEKQATPKMEQIKFADLKDGDRIMVTAAEDVKMKQEFIATKIELLSAFPTAK